MKNPISVFWWLVVPVVIIVGQIILELSIPDRALLARLHSEGGPQETLQSLFLAFALFMAVRGALLVDWSVRKPLGLWFVLAGICTFYVFGEEISWGQHILNWDTPEYWAKLNDQNETNLHNTSAWLDQKPRLILFIGIVFAGLVVPALRRWKPAWLPAKYTAIYPSDILIPTALGVLVPYAIQEVYEHTRGHGIFVRVSEVQELYMYYFVFLYLWDIQNREKSQVLLKQS